MIINYLQVIYYAAISILSLYTLYSALYTFFSRNENINKKIVFLIYAFYIVLSIFTYVATLDSLIIILIHGTTVIVISLIFKCNIKNCLLMALTWTVFKNILELFVVIIFIQIWGRDLLLSRNETLNMIGTASTSLIALIIVKLLQLSKRKEYFNEKKSSFDFLKACIIPGISISIIYMFFEMVFNTHFIDYAILLSLILLVFINVFFFYLFDKLKYSENLKLENLLLKAQKEFYFNIEEEVKSSFQKVRTVKHNLKYDLLYIKAKTQEKNEKALKEIEQKIDLIIGKSLSEDLREYTRNQKLNLLLNYKLQPIEQQGIMIDIKINVSENADFDENVLYVILGNIIDNAVTNFNTENCYNEKDKKLSLLIIDDNGNLCIKARNPFNNKLKFFEGIPITNKKDKLNHGIGLKSIKKIVEEKNGYFSIHTTNNIFVIDIILFDEIPK